MKTEKNKEALDVPIIPDDYMEGTYTALEHRIKLKLDLMDAWKKAIKNIKEKNKGK